VHARSHEAVAGGEAQHAARAHPRHHLEMPRRMRARRCPQEAAAGRRVGGAGASPSRSGAWGKFSLYGMRDTVCGSGSG